MEKSSKIEEIWLEKAREAKKSIVLPEAGFSERIVLAGMKAAEEKIAKIILLVEDNSSLDSYNVVESEYLKVVKDLQKEGKTRYTADG